MKIYSCKRLLVTIFLSVVCFIYKVLHYEDFIDLVWLGIFAFLILKVLFISFSREAHNDYIKKMDRQIRAYCKVFGKFDPIAPYSPCIIILVIGVVSILFPIGEWLTVCLLLVNIVYTIWIFIIVKKHIRIEKNHDFLSNYSND